MKCSEILLEYNSKTDIQKSHGIITYNKTVTGPSNRTGSATITTTLDVYSEWKCMLLFWPLLKKTKQSLFWSTQSGVTGGVPGEQACRTYLGNKCTSHNGTNFYFCKCTENWMHDTAWPFPNCYKRRAICDRVGVVIFCCFSLPVGGKNRGTFRQMSRKRALIKNYDRLPRQFCQSYMPGMIFLKVWLREMRRMRSSKNCSWEREKELFCTLGNRDSFVHFLASKTVFFPPS